MSLRSGPAPSFEPAADSLNRPFRLGTVRERDAANCRVRVVFGEFDQMLSYWLPVVVSKTQKDKVYWLPDAGEQVVCLMDERDEAGVVLGAIYSEPDRPPANSGDVNHIGFSDGTSFEYDRASHLLTISLCDQTRITYDADSHALGVVGGAGMTIVANAPAGIILESGSSHVSIDASGVSIIPPLPTSSTVAQT